MLIRSGSLQRKQRRGGVIVELAIATSLLLTLVFGAIEFGRYVWTRQMLENAAREGARVAIVRTNDLNTSDIQDVVRRYLTTALNQLGPSPTIEVFKVNPATGQPLDVNDNVTTVASAPFYNARFGQAIAVRVTGTYTTINLFASLGQNFNRINATYPITATCIMYSEGN